VAARAATQAAAPVVMPAAAQAERLAAAPVAKQAVEPAELQAAALVGSRADAAVSRAGAAAMWDAIRGGRRSRQRLNPRSS